MPEIWLWAFCAQTNHNNSHIVAGRIPLPFFCQWSKRKELFQEKKTKNMFFLKSCIKHLINLSTTKWRAKYSLRHLWHAKMTRNWKCLCHLSPTLTFCRSMVRGKIVSLHIDSRIKCFKFVPFFQCNVRLCLGVCVCIGSPYTIVVAYFSPIDDDFACGPLVVLLVNRPTYTKSSCIKGRREPFPFNRLFLVH